MKNSILVYELVSKTFKAEDSKPYTGYGIAKRLEGKTVPLIEDITTDAILLSNFVDRLNHAQLPLIHFEDVIDDFIASIAML